MEGGKQWFHSDANDLHLLFEFFSLHDSSSMWIGYLVVWLICTVERWTTYCLDKNCSQHDTARRLVAIAKRTVLYGIATTLRLLYMLVVMYFNTNLFIAVVASLTLSQCIIEIIRLKRQFNHDGNGYSDLRSSNEDLIIPKIIISDE
ncbi:hypothetical protein HMPREF1544_08931 [Mucor circinelloides 1006PhL]|uniref:Copper transport protein n=1 Tax=Mucor circinelloides f. circinelloides (strain 1006PhL) TaxID=1220926 RepID=S2J2R9_MUCC1|nr:hypothetical protein HMPREF1544_08931 [Mucor circinelloides 1006PhL]KAG1099284.1 hypothetical protein G6F42_017853 [Rhizopus arrhizus]